MTPKDPKDPTPYERKHLPAIRLGGSDRAGYTLVEVSVGQDDIIHPSTADHWIYEIALYGDDALIALAKLEPIISRGYMGARVKLAEYKHLRAVAKCTLHGIWEARIVLP